MTTHVCKLADLSRRVSAALALLLLAMAPAVAVELGRQVDFNVTAQPLTSALIEFSRQTDIQILASGQKINGVVSKGVRGRYSIDQGLRVLLDGTGLGFKVVGNNTISLTPAAVGSTGDAPVAGRPPATTPGAVALSSEARTDRDIHKAESIMVTATKREERAQDVPMSIAVIGNQDIERRGLIGMEDYLRSIPGVNEIDKGGADNAIIIRGIATSLENQNNSSSATVAAFFDETPITGAGGRGGGGIDVRPVDIERIEVLRGPQGTAYGSASLGGAVRMIPVKPKLDGFSGNIATSYSGTTGYGGDNTMVQGVLNIPVVRDAFSLRLVGYLYNESGFYRNIAGIDPATIAFAERFGLDEFVRGHVQDDVGRMRSTGGRLAALWQATGNLNLSMNFLTQKIEQDGAPLSTLGAYVQARVPIAPQARMRGEVGEIADNKMDLLNIVLNYDLEWAKLTSAISRVDSSAVSIYSLSTGFQGPASGSMFSDFRSVTSEVRLASQLKGRFQFLGGLFHEDVDEGFSSHFGDWPGMPARNPFVTDPIFLSLVTRHLDQRAIFGEGSYDLTDKVTATAGGRYYKYKKDQSIVFEGGLLGLVAGQPLVPIGRGIAQILKSSEDGSIFKANLSYKPTQDSLVYASWAQGFRLGQPATGLTTLTAVCDTNGDGLLDGTSISIESTRNIKSDHLDNYEVGGKFTLFDRRMFVDTAVYHIKWVELPIQTTARCGTTNAVYTANVGAATSTGVEFQASLLLAKGLRLDFGGGYTKAELAKDAPNLGAQKGARLPGSPQVSANLAVQYDFNVAGYKAFVRADSFYTGKFYTGLLETPDLRAGGYFKADARTGIAINKNLSAELFVRNLTNEDAFTWRAVLGGQVGGSYQLRPRTIGIQLGYRFE